MRLSARRYRAGVDDSGSHPSFCKLERQVACDQGQLVKTPGPGVRVVKNQGSRRNEAALSPEMGVFTPPSPFFKNVECVRETELLVEQQPPQGVFVCDHAGLVINKFSLCTWN